MAQLYQLTKKELAFLDALDGAQDIERRLISHGLVDVTDMGLTVTGKGQLLLEQARAEGALPKRAKSKP